VTETLDLAIRLTEPPTDAGADIIATAALQCDGLEPVVLPLADPLRNDERAELRWYLEQYWLWPYEGFAERGRRVEALLVEIGTRLYAALRATPDAAGLVQHWQSAAADRRQVSIQTDLPTALALPWELLHDERSFLALRTRQPVAIVRRLPQRQGSATPMPFIPPLRILLVTARPEDSGFVDPRSIARELLDELAVQADAGAVALEFLRPPTLSALRQRLRQDPPVHILHFDGHGAFAAGERLVQSDGRLLPGRGQGLLAFEDDRGQAALVQADEVGQVLADSGVRLVVLTACQSAMGAADDAFSSVAARLIRSGVDAVVAMSTNVLVVTAAKYAEAFYRHLATGVPVAEAHERARQALHDDPDRHLEGQYGDREATPVQLRDWWMPHYYQQRPLTLAPTVGRRRTRATAQVPDGAATADIGALPPGPRYGFAGRSRELLQVERALRQGRLVVVQGFGGTGKTALAREAADWLTRTGMYTGACFVSFEGGGDAALLLSTLGAHLGIGDASFDPTEPPTAMVQLAPVLAHRPVMVIADNLESVLPAGEAPLDSAARAEFWDVVLGLARCGAGVVLTSRDVAFGDGRLLPGPAVVYLPLLGLHRDDAYAFASRILDALSIPRVRAPYVDLRALLERLDHHPLAIQLVLPVLRDVPLATVCAEFGALLPRFVDDAATGRNRSLLASLEYSLNRLTQQQQAWLPRLACFEGGALEENLLAVAEIPQTDWAELRTALEQAALIVAERIVGVTAPFLHFHPVLVPALRGRPGADDPTLRRRYAARYLWLARFAHSTDTRSPRQVRALVRRELPNLLRALDLLLDAGDVDAASTMANPLAEMLRSMGLTRISDEVRRRVADATARVEPSGDSAFTSPSWEAAHGLASREFEQGNLDAALARYDAMRRRIEQTPEGEPFGRNSFQHSYVLGQMARCLLHSQRPQQAEARAREALAIVEGLLHRQPDDTVTVRHRAIILTELGSILSAQGRYDEARQVLEEVQRVTEDLNDIRAQAVALGELGTLAERQRDFEDAWARHSAARDRFRVIGDALLEAVAWNQLGAVAQAQDDWLQAERCYRESLAIRERLGEWGEAAGVCNNLGIVARNAARADEAEQWYKRALELGRRSPDERRDAAVLNNLAWLIAEEVRAGRAGRDRLAEARDCAERARVVSERLDTLATSWMPFQILADIEDLAGNAAAAQQYQRSGREAYAAFAGHRHQLELEAGSLVAAIAASVIFPERQAIIKAHLPRIEADGWLVAAATRRIWAGERDWHALSEGLDLKQALLVLRVLEMIEQR
jgi:tetratricopeptide (TPR) repeat protein